MTLKYASIESTFLSRLFKGIYGSYKLVLTSNSLSLLLKPKSQFADNFYLPKQPLFILPTYTGVEKKIARSKIARSPRMPTMLFYYQLTAGDST